MDKQQLQSKLDEKIPASCVSVRDGGKGAKLSYLKGHYVIDRLNQVFGSLGWATDLVSLDKLHEGAIKNRYDQDVHYVSYKAIVRLVVETALADGSVLKTAHTDVGFGDGQDGANPGKSHELAMKEAVTDAMKRCAKNLGQSMGLALYDKDQPNVEDDTDAAPKPQEKQLTKPEQAPKIDISKILKQIGDTSKVLIAKQLASIDELKKIMADDFKVENKEQLSKDQAVVLLDRLSKMLKEKTNEQSK